MDDRVFAARFLDSPRLPGAGYFALTRREVSVYALLNRRARELIRLAFRPSSTGTKDDTPGVKTILLRPEQRSLLLPPEPVLVVRNALRYLDYLKLGTMFAFILFRRSSTYNRLPCPHRYVVRKVYGGTDLANALLGCDDPQWRDWPEEEVWGGPAASIIRMGDLPVDQLNAVGISPFHFPARWDETAMGRYRERAGSLHVAPEAGR
ncbi:hypothetical protein B0H11DRAFT_2234232 [Mycena galericulata]|nr:hypothetical protein B0H11DRAFT_2234232 [Mycena galericulata]